MNKTLLILIFLIEFVLISSASAGPCRLRLRTNNISVNWPSQDLETLESVRIRKRGNNFSSQCTFYVVGFSQGSSGSYNRKVYHPQGDSLDYNLYQFSNQVSVLRDIYDFTDLDQIIWGYQSTISGNLNRSFHFYLPYLNSTIRGGDFTDQVNVYLYSVSSFGTVSLESTRVINVNVTVPKDIALSLVDTGAAFDENDTSQTLDFGVLQNNEENSFDIRIKSNAGYSLFLSSQNNSKLVNQQNSSYSIDYSFYLDNNSHDLSSSSGSAVLVAQAPGVTSHLGAKHEAKVRIGNVSGKLNGTYADYVTVTVVTLE